MKKRTTKLLAITLLLTGATLFASTDYQALTDATTLMSDTQSTVSQAIGLAGFAFGWILLLGFPIGGYYFAYKHFKEKDEQDRSGNANTTMIHAKAGSIALIALIAGSLIFTFLFVNTLHVGNTFGDSVKKVLKIDQAFK